MLLQIREKITGWVAYAIVGIITVPFALWGINFYFQGSGDPIVIEIGDQEITLSRYRNTYINQKRLLEEKAGNNQLNPEQVKQQTITELLRNGLIAQEVARSGYSVSDQMVAESLARSEEFQVDGKFDRETLLQFLSANNITFKQYQESIKRNLRNQQLQVAVSASSFTLDAETELYKELLFQKRNIRYVTIGIDKWVDTQEVSNEEAQEFYAENKEKFQIPIRFKIKYIELKLQDIVNTTVVTEEDGWDFYEVNIQDFIIPEQRTVAHLLFSPDRRGEAEAEQRAQQAYDRLLAGEDFAQLAKEYSDDFTSADSGGELPPFEEDELEEGSVREAIFSLAEGKFSQPVSSRFGIQILKLLSVSPRQQKTYDEVETEILVQIKDVQAQDLYDDKVTELKELTFENEDLDLVADLIDLPLYESEWQSVASQDNFLKYEPFRKEIAESRVFHDGEISEVFEIEPGRIFALQIFEKEAAKQQEYDEVSAKIFIQLRKKKAHKKVAGLVKNMAAELRTGKAFEDVAKTQELEIQEPGFIQRETPDLDPAIINAAYRIAPPNPGKKSYRAARISQRGDYAIIELSEVEIVEEPDEEGIQPLSLFLNEMNLVLQDLTQTIDFNIDTEELNKLEGE